MFVQPKLVHSRGTESHRAGDHAREGADHLSRGPVMAGMFGGFAAAEAFHDAVYSTRTRHVKSLQAHQEASAIDSKAPLAATRFSDMDVRNAATMPAVRCDSDT
jgi:hypothetical protein